MKCRRAASALTFCSGFQPPKGVPSTVSRVTAVWRPFSTSQENTGQSLPKAWTAPESSMVLKAMARLMRSGPSMDGYTSRMFLLGYMKSGWVEAMIPRGLKRAMSSKRGASMCSTRARRSRGPLTLAAFS